MGKLFSQANLQKIIVKFGKPGIYLGHTFAYRQIRDCWPDFKNPKNFSEMILSSMNKKDF